MKEALQLRPVERLQLIEWLSKSLDKPGADIVYNLSIANDDMKITLFLAIYFSFALFLQNGIMANDLFDLQLQPNTSALYRLQYRSGDSGGSIVREFTLSVGEKDSNHNQWFHIHAVIGYQETFDIFFLSNDYPDVNYHSAQSQISKYILQSGSHAVSYQHEFTGKAVLPSNGTWKYLLPRSTEENSNSFPNTVHYLGLQYSLQSAKQIDSIQLPSNIHTIQLLPDALIGVPVNTRQKDETRRYDESEYEYIPLTVADFAEMMDAGMNCFRADQETVDWFQDQNVFYWGISAAELPYPECLYRSNYIGPALFLDEPAVVTRDSVIRPRLRESQEYRRAITPQSVLEDFKTYFHKAKYEGHPTEYLKQLQEREDVNTGNMDFMQQNLYSWETMVSTAVYQLSEGGSAAPNAIVFEPPGRIGSRRTLPEFNMVYECQIPVNSPKNFTGIIYGLLRGAARLTDKEWGTSIYGSVDRTDAFWFLTHAYDMGATRFMIWNAFQLACVPYQESLTLARNLRGHIENHPTRDLVALKQSAEVAILFPPGYNLGHVYMGRGILWGVPELNLERVNQFGVKYRAVMKNLFTEIERCIRLGVEFDMLWELDDMQLSGYREIVRIKEDGTVVIDTARQKEVLPSARIPNRPEGIAPQLEINLSMNTNTSPVNVNAQAILQEGSSPVYYTQGSDSQGVNHNVKVLWELYGPNEEDYTILMDRDDLPTLIESPNQTIIENRFAIEQPGTYRLRAAVSDIAGRTAVVWKEIMIR